MKINLYTNTIRKLTLLAFISFFTLNSILAQSTAIIGAGSQSGTSANSATGDPGPIYRSGATSNFIYSRHHYLYTQSELAAAGIFPGVYITMLSWYKDNAAAFNNAAAFEIWMKNSSLTAVQTPTQTWATLTTGSTQVFGSNVLLTAAIGFVDFNCTAPFLYTGGALEISVSYNHSSSASPWSTLGVSWLKDPISNRTISYCGSTASTNLANARTVRPQIKFTYTQNKAPNDAGVSAYVGPINFCSGNQDVKVRVKNFGSSVLNNVTIQWSLNNVLQTPVSWTSPLDTLGGTLYPNDTMLTLGNIPINAPVLIKAWTEGPNFAQDTVNRNDTASFLASPSLSGAYTIDPTGSGPFNYTSFTAAASALKTNGVCGPVTITVAPGTYIEQVQIDTIPGASAINRVIIDGVDASNRILTFSSSSSSARHTLLLNGTKYITIKNLNVVSTGTYGWPIHLSGVNSQPFAVVIRKCKVDVAGSTAPTATTTNFAGIVCSGSATSATTGSGMDSILIDSNTVNYGYYGIILIGTSTDLGLDNQIHNNTINESYAYPLYASYQGGVRIARNQITGRKPGATAGIYLPNSTNTGTRFHLIESNYIKYPGTYGIYLATSSNTAAAPGLIVNNMVGGDYDATTGYGIYATSASYWNIYHNNFSLNSPGTAATHSTLYVTTGTDWNVQNNIFVNANPTSAGLALYATNASTFTTLNHNLYYKADTTNGLLYLGATLYPATFIGTGGLNANSIFANPEFPSDTVLTTNNGCYNGTNIASITTDINGNLRNNPPDMGCNEIIGSNNDLGIERVSAPVYPMANGLQDLTVILHNYGTNVVTSANVVYQIGNNTPVVFNWSGTLAPCGTVPVTFSGANQINISSTLQRVKIYSSMPNGFADTVPVNDTLTAVFSTPLAGPYTVGGSNADFPSLANAIDAAQAIGIGAAVQFNLLTGTYPTNLFIGSIPGVGVGKQLEINSAARHRDSVTLTHNAVSLTDNYIIKLNNSSFISIKNLTLNPQSSSFARAIDLSGNCSNDTIENCAINVVPSITTSLNIGGIFADNLTGGDNVIRNNRIQGGNFGIYFSGTSSANLTGANNIIEGNTVSGVGYYSIYLYYTNSSKVRNNQITVTAPVYTTHYALTTGYSDNALEVTGNRIHASGLTTSLYGIRIYYCDGNASTPGIIKNNTLYAQTTSTLYGLYSYYSSYQQYYNNTVYGNASGTTNYPVYMYHNSATYSNITMRNNVFHNNGTTGYAMYVYDPQYISSDYNLLYSNSANLVYKGIATATAYPTLTAYRNAFPGMETYSVNFPAAITNFTTMAPNVNDSFAWAMNGTGIQVAGNNADINGNPRSTTLIGGAPDLGAVEFTPVANASLAFAVPATPVAGGTQVFYYGTDTLAKITWDAFTTPPSTIACRLYQGEYPPGTTGLTHQALNMYWLFEAPAGTYNYNIQLYYRNTLIGSLPNETDMIGTKKTGANPWSHFFNPQSTVDTANNILTINNLNDFSYFTGTNSINPLPVDLIGFSGVVSANDAKLLWKTAQEKNSAYFELYRSVNGTNFDVVATLKAKGNSQVMSSYSYLDEGVMAKHHQVWYRLKSIDRDGSYAWSSTITLSGKKQQSLISLYPNPFVKEINLALGNNEAAQVKIQTLAGEVIVESVYTPVDERITITETAQLKPGIYLLQVTQAQENHVIKIIKE